MSHFGAGYRDRLLAAARAAGCPIFSSTSGNGAHILARLAASADGVDLGRSMTLPAAGDPALTGLTVDRFLPGAKALVCVRFERPMSDITSRRSGPGTVSKRPLLPAGSRYDGSDRARSSRPAGPGGSLKGDDTTAIVISVVYRGYSRGLAHPAGAGPGGPDSGLRELAPAVPREMTVIVLCDRGCPWQQIRAQGWHPYMRYRHLLRPGRPPAARPRLRSPSGYRDGNRLRRRRRQTPHPASRGTGGTVDHPDRPSAEEVGVSWYALRFWIELGFKAVKSLGWKWDKTRRTDPARVSRHWLVLSVATLLALAYGTRVEDANERRINLRTPPKALPSQHRCPWRRPGRTVSVAPASTGCGGCCSEAASGAASLLPEPWPEPKNAGGHPPCPCRSAGGGGCRY